MSQIKKIGVIGAGNMGSGIVQKIAQEGIPVVMVDIKDEFVQRGMNTIQTLLREGIERKLFQPEQVEAILSRITGTTDFNAVADADIVIEAVFEDKDVKTEVFPDNPTTFNVDIDIVSFRKAAIKLSKFHDKHQKRFCCYELKDSPDSHFNLTRFYLGFIAEHLKDQNKRHPGWLVTVNDTFFEEYLIGQGEM